MTLDREKFKALVHYICKACSDPSKLGKTKLHKILWYSDGQTYLNTGEPLTGEVYIKESYGPFATHLNEVIAELQNEGQLHTRKVEFYDKEKFEFIAKGEPDIGLFTERELRVIDDNIKHITEDHSASSISERTHDTIWKIAQFREVMPYEALHAGNLAPITEDDRAWAREEIKRLS